MTLGQKLFTLSCSGRIIISTTSNGSNISFIVLLWLKLSELIHVNIYYYELQGSGALLTYISLSCHYYPGR